MASSLHILSKVEELRDILGYGVVSTPGVVINGKVVQRFSA